MEQAGKYIFWLSLFLIGVAYWVGTTNVFRTGGQTLGNLILVSTGRDSSGKFANYPT